MGAKIPGPQKKGWKPPGLVENLPPPLRGFKGGSPQYFFIPYEPRYKSPYVGLLKPHNI